MFGNLFDPDRRFAGKLVQTAKALIEKAMQLAESADNADRNIIISHVKRIKYQEDKWTKIANGTADDLTRSFFDKNSEEWHLKAMNNELSKFTNSPSNYASYLRKIKS